MKAGRIGGQPERSVFSVWVLTGFACCSARKSRSTHAVFRKCSYTCCACSSSKNHIDQNVCLFADTIENNIKFGCPDATHEQVIEAVRNADRILVVEDGRIAECGTHDELMARGGLYRRFTEIRERAELWQLDAE